MSRPIRPAPARLPVAALAVLAAFATRAAAQDNPELGLTDQDDASAAQGSAEAEVSAEGALSADIDASAAPAPGADDPARDTNGDSDHARVVGTFGVGFFGVMNLPILIPGQNLDLTDCVDNFCQGATIPAPTIGVRYWLSEDIGLQAALGFHLSSGEVEVSLPAPAMGGTQDTLSTFGFALHAGVPIALAHAGHFVFEVVPHANLGFASGSVTDPADPGADQDLSGFLFEVGATVGAEIHFGFIGIPQLSLQGNLGLSIRAETRSAEDSTTSTSWSTTHIQTFVNQEPWDLFTGNLNAIYYF